jgi:MFS transporter, PAT family, beta-lactamase induction signal transducer AmpG
VGLGGGAALWMAQWASEPWMTGAALAIALMLCCVALVFVSDPPSAFRTHPIARRLVDVAADVWLVARSRRGFLALLIIFLPIGTGAAANLWSAVADDWHASAGTVALVTGTLSGVVSIFACVVGGYLCDRFDRKFAYATFGVLQSLCAGAMAIAPRTEAVYVCFTMIYAFVTGLTYAGFSAVTLDAIGLGAAATKYSVFISLSNVPIVYMTALEGWAHAQWGANGLLYTEAALGIASVLVFGAVTVLLSRRATSESTGIMRP